MRGLLEFGAAQNAEPDKERGSQPTHRNGIDPTARMGEAGKQLRIASEKTECEWQARALDELRADLERIADGVFQTASERGNTVARSPMDELVLYVEHRLNDAKHHHERETNPRHDAISTGKIRAYNDVLSFMNDAESEADR